VVTFCNLERFSGYVCLSVLVIMVSVSSLLWLQSLGHIQGCRPNLRTFDTSFTCGSAIVTTKVIPP